MNCSMGLHLLQDKNQYTSRHGVDSLCIIITVLLQFDEPVKDIKLPRDTLLSSVNV